MMTNDHDALVADRAVVHVPIEVGRDRAVLDVPADRWVTLTRAELAPAIADPVRAVREALESPLRFPPLRLALTPDDHVTVVVDEHLPRLPDLLTAILEHVVAAGVDP